MSYEKYNDMLLPCPFCGGEAHVERIGNSGYFFVACSTPGCCDSGLFDTEAEAIEAWNTRANDTLQPEKVITPSGETVTTRTCRDTGENEWHFVCSACGYEQNGYEAWNYCPNCGAKVVGE